MPDLSRRDFLKLIRNGFLWLSAALGLGGFGEPVECAFEHGLAGEAFGNPVPFRFF